MPLAHSAIKKDSKLMIVLSVKNSRKFWKSWRSAQLFQRSKVIEGACCAFHKTLAGQVAVKSGTSHYPSTYYLTELAVSVRSLPQTSQQYRDHWPMPNFRFIFSRTMTLFSFSSFYSIGHHWLLSKIVCVNFLRSKRCSHKSNGALPAISITSHPLVFESITFFNSMC